MPILVNGGRFLFWVKAFVSNLGKQILLNAPAPLSRLGRGVGRCPERVEGGEATLDNSVSLKIESQGSWQQIC
jgi:hypothetical protein